MAEHNSTGCWDIVSIHTKVLDGVFVAKLENRNKEGNVLASLEAESPSLKKLVDMIRPFDPINL